MKKSLFPLVIAAVITGCASNEPSYNQEVTGDGSYSEGYLTVDLFSPGGVNTKADAVYADGSESENYISKVRFYFFDEEGKPALVRKNPIAADQYYSYYDWDPTQNDNDTVTKPVPGGAGSTVEKIMSTTLSLTLPTGSSPNSVVAVINPTTSVLNIAGNPTLSVLRTQIDNYVDSLTNKNFVMSNSVYKSTSNDSTMVNYSTVIGESLQTTIDKSQANPLHIYVERVAAKVVLEPFALGNGSTINVKGETLYNIGFTFNPLDPYGGSTDTVQYNNTPLYIRFFGWAVTSSPTMSYLVKEINPDWIDALLGEGEPWNTADYHRSFWAMNPQQVSNNLQTAYHWYSFNDISGQNDAKQIGNTMATTYDYMNENANAYNEGGNMGANPNSPTSVIFAAQLTNANGTPVTVAEYAQQYYTLGGLKSLAAHNLDLFYKDSDDKYQPIQPEMLTFMTSSEYAALPDGNPQPIGQTGNYVAYFTLDTIATKDIEKWYHLNANTVGNETYTEVATANMNQYLFDVLGTAMVWQNGYTYYYFDIAHLNRTEAGGTGTVGVVRNHVYSSKITGIKGLGTPVWNPDEDIDPEKPKRSGNLLTVQIRVLKWRMVSQSYDLSW